MNATRGFPPDITQNTGEKRLKDGELRYPLPLVFEDLPPKRAQAQPL